MSEILSRRCLRITAFAVMGLLVHGVGLQIRAQEEEPEFPHGDFDGDCTQCHSSEGWRPVVISPDFDHSKHGFPLRGSHQQTTCRSCHITLEFAQAPTECAACHLDVHRNELGADCSRCHSTRSFIDRAEMVRNHLATRFPLRGTHRAIDCEDCHTSEGPGNLQWVSTPTECERCHVDAYLAATNPDHQASAFPRTCEQCHSASSWRPAGFNHNTISPGTACVSCHLDNYLGTTDPDHQAAAIPQVCELCHSTRSWTPATDGANHDGLFFPIFSGKHKNEWSSCAECHTGNNFQQFSCIDCHEHDDEVDLTGKHQNVSGFQYNSQACFACHPQGLE